MTTKNLKLTFLGGAETVTGSKILLEYHNKRFLIDCGLFQGLKKLRLLNWAPFQVDPSTIDEIILTHAHLDHCGYIPMLVRNGFRGPIHCTHPTLELSEIILMDSAKIQEEDAQRANTHGYSSHKKPEPLYKITDVVEAMKLFVTHELNEWVILESDLKFQFLNSGHILGSAFVDMKMGETKIFFSGDIGRKKPMLLYPPKEIEYADYIVMESTYGDRLHPETDVKVELLKVIKDTLDRKGILMIPSFAVERTQELIYLIHQLRESDQMPNIPIYLDSPMGVNSTNVYIKNAYWQNLSKYDLSKMYNEIIFITNYEQSRAVVLDKHPKIVIAGSGMMEGGRILHYLNNHIEEKNNTLLFVGFQGEGTRGRDIMEGKKEIKFFGEYRQVKCNIAYLSSLSAHADYGEIIDWFGHLKTKPKTLFLNHGEPVSAQSFKQTIEKTLDWNVEIPKMNSEYLIN